MKNTTTFYPVSSPDVGSLELEYVSNAVKSGWVSSIGEYVDRFEKEFAAYCGVDNGIAMSNGTDALMIALKAMGVGPGDEVVVPSLTFAAVPAVVLHVGAKPVIVDSHPEYWCMDPAAVENAISPSTKAIIVVHLYGHPVDIDPILTLAKSKGIKIIEDCAEAHGAMYKGKRVGSLGDVGCFSFYGNKIITTGEGGMAVTNNNKLADRMRFLKDHAMDPNRRYYHLEAGYNCRMTNLQAALGCAQMQRIEILQEKRKNIFLWYMEELSKIGGIKLNPKMQWADPVNWMVCVLLDDKMINDQQNLILKLKENRIDTRPFFRPVESMPPYRKFKVVGANGNSAPISAKLSKIGLNLPSSSNLERSAVKAISRSFISLVTNQW